MHTVTSEDAAQAAADLTIEVYTSPTRTFVSAITPEGPGDEATWSPTSATSGRGGQTSGKRRLFAPGRQLRAFDGPD